LTHVEKNTILIEGEKIDIEMMIDQFVLFFNAGQETTANTVVDI
jgi:cytochrome P450